MRKRSSIGLILAVTVGAAIVYWFTIGRERHELGRRRHQVTDVDLACHMYASKHGGQFPRDLRDLVEIYGQNSPFLASALVELELVAPGAHPTDNPDGILIQERTPDARGRRMVGYIDGHFSVLGPDGKPITPQPSDLGF